ncbi:MAG: TetR/AcrR family transcriptional regulator [Myxococcota bacterium]
MAEAGTRERLMEAGAELFYAKGYNAVGVQEVCRAASAHKGSFYYFFDSKEALMTAIIEEGRGAPGIVLGSPPPGVRGRDLAIMAYDAAAAEVDAQYRLEGHIKGCPVGSVAAEIATQSEPIRGAACGVLDFMAETIAEVVRRAIAEGDVTGDADPGAIAERAVAYVQGALLLSKTRNDPKVFASLKPGYLLLLGIEGHPKPPRSQ